MKPVASFVIPVYNGQAYLAATLESCLKQTNERWEAIVVDDGSTDYTGDVLAHYEKEDPRFRIIRLSENQGRSNARNVGSIAAQTDVVLTLDADDINIPDRVARTAAYFKRHPEVDICYSKFHNIDEWGNIYTFKKDGVELAEIDAFPFDFEKIKADPNHWTGICHSSMAVRKHVFDDVTYTSGDYCKHGIDDWKFQIDAHKAGFRFGAINRCLVQYRAIRKERDEAAIKELKIQCLA